MGNIFSRLTGNSNKSDNSGAYRRKSSAKPDNQISGSQVEIRKHSTTPVVDTTPKQPPIAVKPLLSAPPRPKKTASKDKNKDKPLYKTTFETQVDAAPPHILEERLQDIQLDQIEIDTNLFTPEVEDAVVKIQAGVRGYLARKQVKELKRDGLNDDQELSDAVVPPPLNFDDPNVNSTEIQTLSPLCDLDKWKSLSQHLEDKVIDGSETDGTDSKPVESGKQDLINNRLIESVIPLKDSTDNKVIETYVCKENILDVEPIDDKSDAPFVGQTVPTLLRTQSEKVVERVFNVLKSETEFENILSFVDFNKTKAESPIDPIVPIVEPIEIKNNDKSNELPESPETPESQVLAKLNEILDTNESIVDNNQSLDEETVNSVETQPQTVDSNNIIVEVVSEEPILEVLKSSIQELTENKPIIDLEICEQLTESNVNSETIVLIDKKIEEFKTERKTDSKIFEEHVIQTIFDESVAQIQNNNQVLAIELFKHDVNEQQLANVTTINEPEEKKQNIEDRVYKTSVDEFVVKPVEPQKPIEQSIPINSETVNPSDDHSAIDLIPVLEAEQKIEIVSTGSRKSSLSNTVDTNEESNEEQVVQTIEVLPMSSPVITIEEQNGRILDEEEAAIRIQAAFRGYQIRRSMSREASPNRTTNHNNIDNNNNNNSQNNDDNNLELFANQTNNDLLIACNPTDISTDGNNDLMSASNEQINSSLERLENQLMQELISSADEDKPETVINESLDKPETILEDIDLCPGELTAPLLLQRLQQSMNAAKEAQVVDHSDVPLESHEDVSEVVPTVVQTLPQIPIDSQLIELSECLTQNNTEELNNSNQSLITQDPIIVEPLIQKSDTIIVDLLSSLPPQKTNSVDEISIAINEQNIEENNLEIVVNPELQTQENLIDVSNEIQELKSELIEISETEVKLESEAVAEVVAEAEVVEAIVEKVLEPEAEPEVLTYVEPPTPEISEITPELAFVPTPQQPILTKIRSSPESEQESEAMVTNTIIENRPSLIPVSESHNKNMSSEQSIPKMPKPILKEKDTKIYTNLINEEQTHSTSEEISSPDDDNPEFVGLGPNTPIPVRASSPNPFGKKRRRGKKSGKKN